MAIYQDIIEICEKYNIHPQRSKGQNFLISEEVYDKIVEQADIKKSDTVVEVGPGLGILTEKLSKMAKKVVAVELDDKLALFLQKKFSGFKNIEIVNQDILDLNPFAILNPKGEESREEIFKDKTHPVPQMRDTPPEEGNYKIVANLPYNITSVFLRKFLSEESRPKSMTLMLQKEVVQRIVARPGEMSLLSVSVQYYAEPEILFTVNRDCFWPRPEVDSAVIKIDLKQNLVRDVDKEKKFFRLVKIGFSSRRKMLKNNLMAGYKISAESANNKLKLAGLDEKIRAQELSLDDWEKLFVLFE